MIKYWLLKHNVIYVNSLKIDFIMIFNLILFLI